MKIEQLPVTKIIYKRRTGAYGHENKGLMEHFKAWLKEQKLFNEAAIILAIPQDDPARCAPDACRYDVALVVDSFDKYENTDINKGTLAAGTYAVFTIDHTENAIAQAIQAIPQEISKYGYSFNLALPLIEYYQVGLVAQGKCKIYVPIK
jgi:DNA gyrase inhibitor GyrI